MLSSYNSVKTKPDKNRACKAGLLESAFPAHHWLELNASELRTGLWSAPLPHSPSCAIAKVSSGRGPA